jgi:hypothetical protein
MIPVNFKYKSDTLDKVERGIEYMLQREHIVSQKIERATRDIEYYRGKVYKLPLTSPERTKDKGRTHIYKFYPKELGKPPVY